MRLATKEEWIERLAHLEKLSLQQADELKQRLDVGVSDYQIEQAGAAALDCARRIEEAKKEIAKYS